MEMQTVRDRLIVGRQPTSIPWDSLSLGMQRELVLLGWTFESALERLSAEGTLEALDRSASESAESSAPRAEGFT